MLDEYFRRKLPKLAEPLISLLKRYRVSPNQVTIASFLSAMSAAYLLYSFQPWLALVAWLLSRLLDGLDGILARATGQQSSFGGYLDILLDMTGYSAMILGFSHMHPQLSPLWEAILLGYVLCITSVLALSSIVESIKNKADAQIQKCFAENNRSIQFSVGLAEASETTIAYLLFICFPQFILWLAWAWLLVLFITVIQRTWLARKLLKNL